MKKKDYEEETLYNSELFYLLEIVDNVETLSRLCKSDGLMSKKDFVHYINFIEKDSILDTDFNLQYIGYYQYIEKYKAISRIYQLRKII